MSYLGDVPKKTQNTRLVEIREFNLIQVCIRFYLFRKYILTVFFKRWMALNILVEMHYSFLGKFILLVFNGGGKMNEILHLHE